MVTWLSPGHEQLADLAVIIVSWNVKDLVLKNIEHLFQSRGSISAELIVIDNASHDGTADTVRRMFPAARVIANEQNLGFGTANNQGIHCSRSRHVLCLNPDMRVAPDALQKTVEYLDQHADVGVLGAQLHAEDGSIQRSVRRLPDFKSQLSLILKLPHVFPHVMDNYLFSDFDYHCEQSAPSVRGAYFAISRSALDRVGLFDEGFFLWFEEVDYCKRVELAGMNVMFVPSIQATDLVGQSFKQKKRFSAQRIFTRSMVRYFSKWHPVWQAILLMIVRPIGLIFCLGADLFLFKPKKSYA
ncbi:MAG TPA: glycosyltransferase family 2 protein [Patescibacteria group bacterium]|nr:glycosyltransferase family 2 protein [Patescibacteria group bacterium]